MRAASDTSRQLAILDHSTSARIAAKRLMSYSEWVVASVLPFSGEARPALWRPAPWVEPAVVVMPLWARARAAPGFATPLLILYCVPDHIDHALLLGAHDILVEPWTVAELSARVERAGVASVARRVRALVDSLFVPHSPTGSIPQSSRLVLEHLLRNDGRVVDRSTLERAIGRRNRRDAASRSVDMAVSRLRRVVAPFGITIESVRGIGYRAVVGSSGHAAPTLGDKVWKN